MTSIDELKTMLEGFISESHRRRESDLEWRGRVESSLKTLRDEVESQRAKHERLDREHAATAKKARDAMESHHDLERGVMTAVGNFSTSFAARLDAQDKDVGALRSEVGVVRRETMAQTPLLTEAHEFIVATKSQYRLIKYLLTFGPVVVGAIVGLAHYAAMLQPLAHH